MEKKQNQDEIMLGFGHGYLITSDIIIDEVKKMRKEIGSITGSDFPRIHIIDHDYDLERNNVRLKENEFVIRINGIEKVRCQSENIQSNPIILELKKVILDNIDSLKQT